MGVMDGALALTFDWVATKAFGIALERAFLPEPSPDDFARGGALHLRAGDGKRPTAGVAVAFTVQEALRRSSGSAFS